MVGAAGVVTGARDGPGYGGAGVLTASCLSNVRFICLSKSIKEWVFYTDYEFLV